MLSPKINNIDKIRDNRPKVNRLTTVLGIIFYIINNLEKTDVWGEKDALEKVIGDQ